ncbi:hypothetical protein SNE40_002969 [Patella caerulea]|uniref:Uncharacterized protein n=1 Tax=Patella caerulea TaxID=87958 RepID=A0AAN8K9U3_PATCE
MLYNPVESIESYVQQHQFSHKNLQNPDISHHDRNVLQDALANHCHLSTPQQPLENPAKENRNLNYNTNSSCTHPRMENLTAAQPVTPPKLESNAHAFIPAPIQQNISARQSPQPVKLHTYPNVVREEFHPQRDQDRYLQQDTQPSVTSELT